MFEDHARPIDPAAPFTPGAARLIPPKYRSFPADTDRLFQNAEISPRHKPTPRPVVPTPGWRKRDRILVGLIVGIPRVVVGGLLGYFLHHIAIVAAYLGPSSWADERLPVLMLHILGLSRRTVANARTTLSGGEHA